MNVERLCTMANDIANFFAVEPDRAVGVAGVAEHLRKFWDPRMRKQIIAHLGSGGEGLQPLARDAVAALAQATLAQEQRSR